MATSPAFLLPDSRPRGSVQRSWLRPLLLLGLAGGSACALETRPGDGLVSDGREIQVLPSVPADAGAPSTIPMGMEGMEAPPCTNLPLFQQKVLPYYVADCLECHGGMKPKAVAKLALITLPMEPELACVFTLAQAAKSSDPLQAEILSSCDPARKDKVHDFKYEDPAAFNRYRDDVLVWLRAEKMVAP